MGTKTLFDTGAMQYDLHRQKVIPCFEVFYKTIVDLIPFRLGKSFSFLDLGTGTGLLAALILDIFPKAHACVMDISDNMLAVARKRFADYDNVTFFVGDYAGESLSGHYDLIVSAMSIHHLTHKLKLKLMKKIYHILEPGGMFINADLATGSTPVAEKFYHRHWIDYLEHSGLTADELDVIYERMSHDLPATLESQLLWMQQAGFNEVDCCYKYFNFVVYSGKK